jgi:hypothetical protein
MKKLILALGLVMTTLSTQASHLLGGFINVTQHGFTDTVTINVTLFSDPQGIANPTTITLTDLVKVNSFYQSPTTIAVMQTGTGTWQGINTSVYSVVTTLTAGDHRLIYTNCCRGILTNATSSMNSNFTIALDYKKTAAGTVPNSAPFVLNYLPVKWVNGSTSQSMLFAFDLDGDSVLIEMDDAINQHANNVFVPLAPFTQLTSYGSYNVDPNGLIKWKPNTLGQFGTGFKISEFRNGQLIGMNRVQQVFQVENGSTPNVIAPFNMTLNNDSTITILHDLVDGDSLYVGFTGSNYLGTQLVVLGTTINGVSNTTWSMTDLTLPGVYHGFLRIYGSNSNMDFPITMIVTSTIGVDELTIAKGYEVWDWMGNFIGKNVDWRQLHGFYILRYDDGRIEKTYVE